MPVYKKVIVQYLNFLYFDLNHIGILAASPLPQAAPFGDTDDQSRLNLHRATALSMTRQFDEALVLAHRVEKVFTEAEDAVRASKVLSVVAQIQISTSEYKKCLDAVERRKKAYQLLAKESSIGPENDKTADLLVELAEAYAEVAKHDLAAQCLRRALAIYKVRMTAMQLVLTQSRDVGVLVSCIISCL